MLSVLLSLLASSESGSEGQGQSRSRGGRRAEFLMRRSETRGTDIQVAADIIDVTLAPKDGLQDSAHQVVLNLNEDTPQSLPSSILSPSTTAPPATFSSTPSSSSLPPSIQASTTPTPKTSPPSSPGWKVVSPKHRKAILPTISSVSDPPVPSPKKLAYTTFFDRRAWRQVFKCKKGEVSSTWVHRDCDVHWPDLQLLEYHDFQHHGGPRPIPP